MKGAPSGRPAAGAGPSAGKGAKGGAAPGKLPGKGTSAGEDDPFEAEAKTARKAIPLSAKPVSGRTVEVRCPMCETVGYGPPKVAGQLVKCANPSCSVPVFAVRNLQREEPVAVPRPAKSKSPLPLYAVLGGAVLAGAGGLVWYLNSIKPPDKLPGAIPVPPRVSSLPPEEGPEPEEVPGTTPTGTVPAAGGRAAELKESLSQAVSAALKSPATKKAYGRRMTALAYGHTGDTAGFQEQLEQLRKLGQQSPYEVIPPLGLQVLRMLPAEATVPPAVLEEVKRVAPTLPNRGRFATESAILSAAVLAAAGDHAAGQEVLQQHRAAPLVEQLAALRQLSEMDGGFDLAQDRPLRDEGEWNHPLETAVTLLLAQQGRWEAAEKWAASLPAEPVRDESWLVLAEQRLAGELGQDADAALRRAEGMRTKLSGVGQVRFAARLARACRKAGRQAEAERELKSAVAGLAGLKATAPPRLGDPRSALEARLPEAGPLLEGARAALEVAGLQAADNPEAAWESIATGLSLLRGLGPTQQAVDRLKVRLADSEVEGLRRELRKAFALANDDQVRRKLTQFRESMTQLEDRANLRFEQTIQLLSGAVAQGLEGQVWQEVLARDGDVDGNLREPLVATALTPLVAFACEDRGDAALATRIRTEHANRWAEAGPNEELRVLPRVLRQLAKHGDIGGLLSALNPKLSENGQMQETALELASELVDEGRVAEALQLASGLGLESLREDALYLVAARSARLDKGAELRGALPGQMKVTEVSAIQSGLAAGWGELLRTQK